MSYPGNVQKNKPKERVFVSRLQGSEEMKRDILGLYRDPRKNLRAPLQLRFEGEEGLAWVQSGNSLSVP